MLMNLYYMVRFSTFTHRHKSFSRSLNNLMPSLTMRKLFSKLLNNCLCGHS